jgi:hypothetical protein
MILILTERFPSRNKADQPPMYCKQDQSVILRAISRNGTSGILTPRRIILAPAKADETMLVQ